MFKIVQFRKNVYFSSPEFFNDFVTCPLCKYGVYNENENKYDMTIHSNLLYVCEQLCCCNNINDYRKIYYCLHYETLLSWSYQISYMIHCHVLIVSEFKYEDKIIVGNLRFDSFFSFCRDVEEKKLTDFVFICTCMDDHSTKSPSLINNNCVKRFIIYNISVMPNNHNLSLIPKNTKCAQLSKK